MARRSRFELDVGSEHRIRQKVPREPSRSRANDRINRTKWLGFLALFMILCLLIVAVCMRAEIQSIFNLGGSQDLKDLDAWGLSQLLERVSRQILKK